MNDKLVDATTEFGASALGAAIGSVIAGPLGTVGGAIAGTAIEKAILSLGNEIKSRLLSPKEQERIGAVYKYATQKINDKLSAGQELRSDSFFTFGGNNRSSDEEILEGVLLVAQKEHEEKKLKYLGNLYANISFDTSINPSMANMLLKLSTALTYRQLVILKVVAQFQTGEKSVDLKQDPYSSLCSIEAITIATEIFELYRQTLVHSSEACLDAVSINPSKLKLVGYGLLIYRLMELENIIEDEIQTEITRFMVGSIDTASSDTIVSGTIDRLLAEGNNSTSTQIKELQAKVDSIPKINFFTNDNEDGSASLILDCGDTKR